PSRAATSALQETSILPRTCRKGSSLLPPKSDAAMEAVPALEPRTDKPPLTAARLRRQLTVEHAAKLARLTPDEVTWLEEGRLYRFPSSDSALLALLLYSTALGIGRREARQLAGLPILPRPPRIDRVRGLVGAALAAVVLV